MGSEAGEASVRFVCRMGKAPCFLPNAAGPNAEGRMAESFMGGLLGVRISISPSGEASLMNCRQWPADRERCDGVLAVHVGVRDGRLFGVHSKAEALAGNLNIGAGVQASARAPYQAAHKKVR